MSAYIAIAFNVNPRHFKDDQEIVSALRTATGDDTIQVQRLPDADGSHTTASTWFLLTSTENATSLKELALSIDMGKVEGLASVMLKTESGKIESPRPLRKLPTGVQMNRPPFHKP
ncbi:MAG: hypothetical protein HY052_07285 [Proteobacteria bacterium]|nr:hypothetical protein [Pseudomonadota bacterium]